MKSLFKTYLLLAALSVAFWVTGTSNAKAQSTLAAGDLIFTSYNSVGTAASSIPDTFSFVLLVPISSNTQIYFTDRGYFGPLGAWQAANGNTEGVILWTSGSALAAGTEVAIHGFSASVNGVPNGTMSANTANPTIGIALGSTGDQIIAFQGGGGDPASGTRIAGMHWNLCASGVTDAGWDNNACASLSNNPVVSTMPPGLTGGVSAFFVGDPGLGGGACYTQGKFNCNGTPSSNAAGVRTAVMNKANWVFGTSTTATSINVPPGCLYISACPPAAITGNPPNRTVCENGTTTFPITATGAGLTYQWQVDQGLGFGNVPASAPYSGTTTNTLTITGATAAMSGYLYRCVVTGTCGNATSNAGTLTVAAINMSVFSSTNVTCPGGNNGSASITPSGGFLPYTFSWSPSGGTGASASGLTANTYTVTVTNNVPCTATRTYVISEPPAITITTTAQSNVSCNGGSNGSATISASGGTGTLGYSWAPSGGTSPSITGRSAGVYTVTVTDAASCTKTHTVTITEPTVITLNAGTVNNVSCFGGTNGSAQVIATGGTPGPGYSYSWAPSGGTGATASGLAAGTYTVTVTDNNSCTRSRTFSITQPSAALSTTAGTVNNVSCFGGTNGSATVIASGGTPGPGYTYSWAPSGGTAATASGLGAGNYTVTVTDNNSCTTTRVFSITQPAAALSTTAGTVNMVSCFGGNNGSAQVIPAGGTPGPGYTYSWAPSGGTAATATGLTANTYTVTVTDNNSCTTTRVFSITQPAAALSTTAGTINNVSCFGGANGSATVIPAGGTPSYSYSWAPSGGTGATASGLSAGVYTVTVTDSKLCTTTRTFNVTQPAAALSSTAGTVNHVNCFGASTGSATVIASGGTPSYSYSWAPSGGTNATASGLAAGTYTVTITDFNTCTTTRTFTINQPAAGITTSAGTVNMVSCFGGNNGSAQVIASGGNPGPGYSYSWAPSGGTASTATGLTANTYTVTVTDANSCTATRSFVISQPTQLTTTAGTVNMVSCNGGANGSATVIPAGGTPGPGYTYSWAPSGGTGPTATGLAANTYTVTVTDNNSCTVSRTFTITQPTALSTSTGTVVNVSCNGGNNGSAQVIASGGTPGPGYSYSWAPSGGTAATATGLIAGTYTVTVTDNNSCTKTHTFSISQPPAFTVGYTVTPNDTVCQGRMVTFTGTGAVSYTWTGGISNGVPFAASTTTTYTVTGTDASSCTKTATATLTVNALPAVGSTANPSATFCMGESTTLNGTGANTYTWTGGVTNGVAFTPVASGVYTVTGTDVNNCSNTSSISITVYSLPNVTSTVLPSNTVCFGDDIVFYGSGATSYTWTGSVTDGVPVTALTSDTYTVTGTDANGCSATSSVSVTVNSLPSVTASATDTILCDGEATTLSGGGAVSYSWTNGVDDGVAFTPVATDIYTVTGTDANTCSNTASILITVNPLPSISYSVSPGDTVCTGTEVTLSGTGGDSYSWTGSVTDTIPFTIVSTGTYTVTGTDVNGCTNTASATIEVNALPTVTGSVTPAVPVCEGDTLVLEGAGASSYSWSDGVTNGVGFPADAAITSYVVTGTDTNGCANTDTIDVSVNPLPVIGYTVAPNDTVCQGTNITLGGTGASIYTWSGGITNNVPFVINSTTTYTVTGTDVNSCSNTGTATITVGTPITVSLGPDVIQPNPPAILDAGTGFDSYVWNTSPPQTTQTISATTNGTYIVTVTKLGCSDSDTIQVFFTAGVNGEMGQQAIVKLYPNPSDGVFNISIDNLETDNLVINIIDMTGRTVYNYVGGSIHSKTIVPFDMSSLSMGTYVLSLHANGSVTHLNFVVNK